MIAGGNTTIIEPIGMIHTVLRDKYGAPRQPNSVHDEHLHSANTSAVIELLPQRNFEQAVEDLKGFERIWVVFVFHKNHGWKPKVQPPRSRKKYSVFATRSPHRPNRIGLSAVQLLRVEGRYLHIGAHDFLDGTPILDIKPYIPLYDSFPEAKAGWVDDSAEHLITTMFKYSPLFHAQEAWLREKGIDLLRHIEPLLRHDPYPHRYKRIKTHPEGFVVAWKAWRVIYSMSEQATERYMTLHRIESGYTEEAIMQAHNNNAPETLYDGSAHWEFFEKFYAIKKKLS